jgi:hypothetical protein
MEMSGQLRATAALPPGKEPQYPLNERLVEPQSQSGRPGEEKHLFVLLGFEPRTVQPVA